MVTRDPFSDGGRYVKHRAAIEHGASTMAGGRRGHHRRRRRVHAARVETSAPRRAGARAAVIEALVRGGDGRPRLPIPISIDTRKPEVAEAALVTGLRDGE
jgi:dihydropteroate synthase